METIKKEIEIKQLNDPAAAIAYLAAEYPHGIDLVYIDYRDQFEDMTKLQAVLKDGGDDVFEGNDDGSYESIMEVLKNYKESEGADEISDEVEDAMREWLYEHDTSDAVRQLLKNTGAKLCYIETPDYAEQNAAINTGCDPADARRIIRKYGKTAEQKKEVARVLGEQFYGAPVSFYFYADVEDLYNVLQREQSKYIEVIGAYIGTVDRVQGSNWLGDNALFTISVDRKRFMDSFYLDQADGNGYGWERICGGSSYEDCQVNGMDKVRAGSIRIKAETSEAQKREQKLAAHWKKTGECTAGDMNTSRHASAPYRNDYPAGNKCEKCGTFWID